MSFLAHKLKCVTCGKDFEGKKIDSKNCSKECRVKAGHIKRKHVNGEKLAQKIKQIKPKQCKVCNEMFIPYVGKIDIQVYCGQVCQQKDMHKMRTEKPGYHEQRREYAVEYRKVNHSEKRMKAMDHSYKVRYGGNYIPALERDNYTCCVCGETERDKLHVHHKDHSGKTKNPNHNLDNLETLCHSCHMKHHMSKENNLKTFTIPDEEVKQVIISSHTVVEAAEKLNVSAWWVNKWKREHGYFNVMEECPVCGTEFKHKANKKYCSANCKYQVQLGKIKL